jgi:hypothetical protein
MRPREEELIDPEITERLDAIDATLAGEPVAPRFAELAELALLVCAERPEGPRAEFARELDGRVAGRFGVGVAGRSGAGWREPARGGAVGAGSGGSRRRWWSSWGMAPSLVAAATAVAALVVVVAALSSGGGDINTATTVSKAPGAKTLKPSLPAPGPASALSGATASTGARTTTPSTAANQAILGVLAPAPVPNGRKIIQSSTLQLGTPAGRIDAVAQEIFSEVRAVNGIVERSNVASTSGPGANAQFQLRIPSLLLSDALSVLSRLRYANVVSRTDNTQDVNSPYLSLQRQIARAKATLVELRAQLAAAVTETEVTSRKQQIANENAVLARARGSLRSLSRKVDYSNVYVTVQATAGGMPPGGGSGGGFGLHQAGRDALRVLEVTAGIALIVLAALLPLGLVAALTWWIGATMQRRRRERALDMA